MIVVVDGAATAFFNPASDAILPQLLPKEVLAQANSLDQLIRPLALRLAGPALGGVLVGRARHRLGVRAGRRLVRVLGRGASGDRAGAGLGAPERSVGVREIRAGLRYVRNHPWLWATLVSAAIAYLLFMGPTEVLLPFVVKHRFADGADDLGLIFAAGGVGSLACALAIGQLGCPAAASRSCTSSGPLRPSRWRGTACPMGCGA